MYWLITYSQTEKGRELSATTVIDEEPGKWFADLCERYPSIINKMHFAIEIKKEDFDRLEAAL